MSDQFEIDFANPINPWADNEAREAIHWTPEALCMVWACGREDREWWAGLKNYERTAWLARYADQCDRIERGLPLQTARYVMEMEDDAYKHNKRLAESWANELRQAFVERRQCPIKPAPGFEHILTWAFMLAQIPAECMGENAQRDD